MGFWKKLIGEESFESEKKRDKKAAAKNKAKKRFKPKGKHTGEKKKKWWQ